MTTRRRLLASAALSPALLTRATAQEATPVANPAAPIQERDIVYGAVAGEELLLDVWRPPPRELPRPAMVVIHGGGWTEGFGDRTDFVSPSFELAKAGYVVFNIEYRLLPDHPWPAQLDDVQRAVRWIRANAATYGVDPERIGSYGHSSGGHLAAFLGVRDTRDNSDPALSAFSSRVACVVDLDGDMDLTIPIPYGDAESNALIVRFLGGTAAEVPDAYRDASPISWVGGDSAPFLILHATHDEWVPVAHARGMEAALHEAGVPVVYYEDPEAVHITSLTWHYVAPWVLTSCAVHLEPEN